jgi:hypothetical protein
MPPNKPGSGLSAEEAPRVVELIRPRFEDYVANFNERKYPSGVYEQVRRTFGTPQRVIDSDIRDAICWKFGHLIKKKSTIPPSHEALIAELQRKWSIISSDLTGSASEIFLRLRTATGGKGRYVTVSFLLHLLRPSEIPMIDQHNFRAMNHYLMTVRIGWQPKSKPSTYDDLTTLASFMSGTLSSWQAIDPATVPSERELDRFLMMFGKALKTRKPLVLRKPPSPNASSGPKREQNSLNRTIRLPFGGAGATFTIDRLIEHLNHAGRDCIIQGQTNCALSLHPKPHSLDFWLRQNCTDKHDTKQAVNEVIDQLVSTGLFEEGKFPCPDSRRFCKGIRLVRTEAAQ